MPKHKIAITVKKDLLGEIDRLVLAGVYPNRSRAIEAAVEDQIARIRKTRLLAECRKLDPAFERALAEEAISTDAKEWPEY